jgi:hypothetical protein
MGGFRCGNPDCNVCGGGPRQAPPPWWAWPLVGTVLLVLVWLLTGVL